MVNGKNKPFKAQRIYKSPNLKLLPWNKGNYKNATFSSTKKVISKCPPSEKKDISLTLIILSYFQNNLSRDN